MSKNLSAKYCQENKERFQKKAYERYQNLSKEKKKEEKQQYGRECYKNFQKMKNKSLLSIEKILQNKKKHFIIIIRKHFNLENFSSSYGKA